MQNKSLLNCSSADNKSNAAGACSSLSRKSAVQYNDTSIVCSHNRIIPRLIISILLTLLLTVVAGCGKSTVLSVVVNDSQLTQSFYTGDKIDPASLFLHVKYSDGTSENIPITEDMCIMPDMSVSGEKTMTVTYSDKKVGTVSADYKFTVVDPANIKTAKRELTAATEESKTNKSKTIKFSYSMKYDSDFFKLTSAENKDVYQAENKDKKNFPDVRITVTLIADKTLQETADQLIKNNKISETAEGAVVGSEQYPAIILHHQKKFASTTSLTDYYVVERSQCVLLIEAVCYPEVEDSLGLLQKSMLDSLVLGD